MGKQTDLLSQIKACSLCQDLPLGAKPILQFNPKAKILIAGQAPGRITHHKGIPFDDPSGKRLRDWLGIDRETFYQSNKIAIIPMGFCFPGTGKSGDLGPRPLCAQTWRKALLEQLSELELSLLIGRYAMNWHLPSTKKISLTEAIQNREIYGDTILPLPHPSPRNNLWLAKNPWFEKQVLPELKCKVKKILEQ